MTIQWLGHSCFRLVESTGTTVITDPYDDRIGHTLPAGLKADIVTLSHHHTDHNYHSNIGTNPIIIDQPGIYDIKGVNITTIPSYHDNEKGALRGSNLMYMYHLDGVSVAHMGDIGEECTPELVEQLLPANILLIPVGGNYTINAEQARAYIDALMPDIVIPMHYKTRQSLIDLDKLEVFLRLFDPAQITYSDSPDGLVFHREYFDGTTHIIVPELTTQV